MADSYINGVGVAAIRDWANGKFALDADLDTLAAEVDEIIAEGGEPNVIETVKVDGTALVPDAQKAVDIDLAGNLEGYAILESGEDAVNLVNGAGTIDVMFTYNRANSTMEVESSAMSPDPSPLATVAYVNANGGKIDSISVNGTAQTIDANKNVNISTLVQDIYVDSNYNAYKIADSSGTNYFRISDLTTGYAPYPDIQKPVINLRVDRNGQTFINRMLTTMGWVADYVASQLPTAVSELTNDSGYQTASDVQSAISTAVSSVYKFKGHVATYADLPASGQTVGDVWDVQATGVNYAWDGTSWDELGPYVDTSTLWSNVSGQTNSLVAMTVAEVNAILEPSA